MSSVKRSRRFFSMPIVSVEEGQQIGYVKNLVVNAATLEVVALLVEPKGLFKEQKVIPYTRVKSIGEDAIIIEKSGSAEKPANLPQIMQLIKDKIELVGTKVIDETGLALGVVEEYLVEPTNGKIISFEIGGKFLDSLVKGKAYLPAEEIKTVGKDVLIAKAEAGAKLVRVEAGLPETWKSLKEGSSHLLEATRRKSKNLGQAISKGWLPKRAGKTACDQAGQLPAEELTTPGPPPAQEVIQVTPPTVDSKSPANENETPAEEATSSKTEEPPK